MKSLKTLLQEHTELLQNSGIMEARLDAWLLLEFVLKKNRAWYLAHADEEADEQLEEQYGALIRKRAEHIPLQHLTHQAYFMGYEFYVDEHVLIPRQDTETLVEEALNVLSGNKNPCIMDMCTGSGCILLSLLLEKPEAMGVGVDLSEKALKVALKNADNFALRDRVELIHSDMFQSAKLREKYGNEGIRCDILVSNPPYIRTEEIEHLMDEVRFHDPYMALDGKEDGLYFYREIVTEAGFYLKEGGALLCEIGFDQGEAVRELYQRAGYQDIRVIKDLSGLDRVVYGRK